MDLLEVLRPFFDFFIDYCSIVISLGGFSFTVGSFFLWCGLVLIIAGFVKGLGNG